MAESNLKLGENQVRYVFEDDEYILGHETIGPEGEFSALGNLICADGSRAILVDGQYILTDSPAILLQEGDSSWTQYYINDNTEGLIVDSGENSVNSLFKTTEVVQFIEDDTNDGQQIVYYTNDEADSGEFMSPVDGLTDGHVEGIQDEDGNIYPFKRIKLEGEEDEETRGLDEESVEYTIMEEDNQAESQKTRENQEVDLSKITGRNLITGQTVTLHSYMEKLKRRLNKTNSCESSDRRSSKKFYADANNCLKIEERRNDEFSDLIDRKISIGKTKSGRRIIGKIIHVERKKEETKERHGEACGESVDEENEEHDRTKILIRKCTVSKESFEQISKTLGGVMEMESVRSKLENKNIVVKLVEKKYVNESDAFVKNTSYSYGYMEQELGAGPNDGDDVTDKWRFIPDQETHAALLSDHFNNNEDTKSEKKAAKYPITTSLTILITYEKAGNKTVRVHLNPAPGNLCTVCVQYFKTNLQLRQHMNQAHNTFAANIPTACEVCERAFDDFQELQTHRNLHIEEGRLFACNKCNRCFSSQNKLRKHLPSHDLFLRPLECSVCKVRCSSETALKKHLLTHTGLKPFLCDVCGQQFQTPYNLTFHKKIHFPENYYACNVCMRTFSRYSNLLRHQEIHKGNGALFKCDICYCSYNYVSSLTRHMVQNHLEEFRRRQKRVGDTI